jgi:hypothetical protein
MSTEEEVDFDILREPWSKYLLEDGTLARVKNPVLHIFKSSEINSDGLPTYRTDGASLLSTTVPKKLYGKPTVDSDSKELLSEIRFDIIREDWCDYKTSDGMIIKTKTRVTRVRKSSTFNNDGAPKYLVDCQIDSNSFKLKDSLKSL